MTVFCAFVVGSAIQTFIKAVVMASLTSWKVTFVAIRSVLSSIVALSMEWFSLNARVRDSFASA